MTLSPLSTQAACLSLCGAIALGLLPSAVAASPRAARSAQSASIFVPPTRETHSTSRAGGSRNPGGCRHDSAQAVLTAIAPQAQVGLTTAAAPKLLVYVPETSAQQLYFSVKTASGAGHYEAVVPIAQPDRVVALSLPAEAALAEGETYSWGVGLICPSGQTDMPWAQGKLQRVAARIPLPDTPLDQAIALGQAGLWYDAVAALEVARDTAPGPQQSELLRHWSQLLDWTGAAPPATESILSTMF